MSKFQVRASSRDEEVVLPQAAGAEMDDLVKVLKGFDKGAAAGPSGPRPQFLLEMVGEEGDDPVVRAIFEVTMLFVEGKAPKFLKQWYSGGKLIGIGKDGKPLTENARCIVVGGLLDGLPAN